MNSKRSFWWKRACCPLRPLTSLRRRQRGQRKHGGHKIKKAKSCAIKRTCCASTTSTSQRLFKKLRRPCPPTRRRSHRRTPSGSAELRKMRTGAGRAKAKSTDAEKSSGTVGKWMETIIAERGTMGTRQPTEEGGGGGGGGRRGGRWCYRSVCSRVVNASEKCDSKTPMTLRPRVFSNSVKSASRLSFRDARRSRPPFGSAGGGGRVAMRVVKRRTMGLSGYRDAAASRRRGAVSVSKSPSTRACPLTSDAASGPASSATRSMRLMAYSSSSRVRGGASASTTSAGVTKTSLGDSSDPGAPVKRSGPGTWSGGGPSTRPTIGRLTGKRGRGSLASSCVELLRIAWRASKSAPFTTSGSRSDNTLDALSLNRNLSISFASIASAGSASRSTNELDRATAPIAPLTREAKRCADSPPLRLDDPYSTSSSDL
mmetsp:Transcript_40324/g.54871  ORF Transcript_40324/g.54871 Transcript_40324/m.54871 type:complete len:429 (-) Transcript_40324:1802-3088(-)